LIYPVYSPLRNKLARTPGQGTSRRRKVITGVSGSQTGPSGGKFVRLAIPELVQGGGSISGTSGAVNWPLNLPGTGNQDAVDLIVPFCKGRGLARRRASANRENCWNTRVTRLHHSVARKGERDGSRS
jgi:hypothetical protein